jgi:peptidoglycan/xylan/chitin deacetylase (PgdA/CDA1 family)
MSVRQRRPFPRPIVMAVAVALGTLLVLGSMGWAPGTVSAATYTVRLEAGPQTGYRFSTTGVILGRKTVELASPATVAANRRSSVPGHTGAWLRITSGTFAGYEVRESLLAHVPGKIGDIAYSPSSTITFAAGKYLGYTFDSAWDLATSRRGTTTTTIFARASRRAVIDGRPYVLMNSGPWTGYWIPVTAHGSRAAQRITCTVPAKVAPGSAVVYQRVGTTDPQIALTFDMGGRMTPALDIMERLIIDRVCATIFPTGAAAATTDGRTVMAMIRAHPELFEVGNHTQHHCNLRDGGGGAACPADPPTTARIQAELLDADLVIRSLAGKTGVPYWRPPYGAHDARVRAAAAAVGFTKTIMWDIDTIDWRPTADGGPTAGSMAAKVVTNARTGSIVLMHLGGYHTYDALPSMVARLRSGGLQPSTITGLLRAG